MPSLPAKIRVGALQLRAVEPDDGDSLHALLRSTLTGVPDDRQRWLRRWRWACWDNPFRGDRPAGWVLEDEGQVVGHLGAVYVPLRIEGQQRLGQIGTDYAVASTATVQGGVFAGLTLAQAFFDGLGDAVPLATTANEKTAAVFGRFGCQPIAWTREFWRIRTGLDAQLRACRGGTSRVWRRILSGASGEVLKGGLACVMNCLDRQPAIPMLPDCDLEVTVPRLASDLSKLDGRCKLAFLRNASYLQWRYAQHPEHDACRVLVIREQGDEPIAAAYLFVDHATDPPIAHVEDVLLPAPSPDLLRTLFCAAQRIAVAAGAEYLHCTTGNLWCRPLFWELGWESRARNAPALLMRSPAGTDTPASQPNFWHGAMF